MIRFSRRKRPDRPDRRVDNGRQQRDERIHRRVHQQLRLEDEQAMKEREAHLVLTEKAVKGRQWERDVKNPEFSTMYAHIVFAKWILATVSSETEARVCPCCFAVVLADPREGDFTWAHARWHHERGDAPVPDELLTDTWF